MHGPASPPLNDSKQETAMTIRAHSSRSLPRLPLWLGACLFSAVALFFLWTEHRAHLLGALPYLLLLSCPLMHLFMHHGHHHDQQLPERACSEPSGQDHAQHQGNAQ